MRSLLRTHRERIQIVLSLVMIAVSLPDMIGVPARLVTLLTLSAGCLGAGISIGVLVERRRSERRASSPAIPHEPH